MDSKSLVTASNISPDQQQKKTNTNKKTYKKPRPFNVIQRMGQDKRIMDSKSIVTASNISPDQQKEKDKCKQIDNKKTRPFNVILRMG